MRIALLAGGTGAAKLARGLASLGRGIDLTVVTNTADDDHFWGLLVCPDTDAVVYRLAGLFNESSGFGVRDETFAALSMLERLGEPVWFGLGDRDIGLHLLRDTLLQRGLTLAEATLEITRRLGITPRVLPMSNDPVRTRITTDSGTVSLQEWFVRDGCVPAFRGCRFDGLESAAPSPDVVAAVRDADIVLIGPSNPVISVEPVLALVRPHLRRERVVAVTPVVGGRSLKGPTVAMLEQLDGDATALTVARRYASIARHFVLDAVDMHMAGEIASLGMSAHVMDTVMADEEAERRVADELVQTIAVVAELP